MIYSWNIITPKDIVYLRNVILEDFDDFLRSKADRINTIHTYVKNEICYDVIIKDRCYRYNPDDYIDLCFNIATELYRNNIEFNYNYYELMEEYDREKSHIMCYMYSVFVGAIKVDLNKEEKGE